VKNTTDRDSLRDSGQLTLLVFGINYEPELTGIAVITTWLTRSLAERGWNVTMITGIPHYPAWRRQPAPRRTHNGAVAVRRHVHYVPARQSAVRRAAYELTWTATAVRSLLTRRRPDLVLGIVPSLGGGVLARLASMRYGVPYALLFQDVMGRAAEQAGVPGSRRVAGLVARIETALAHRAAGIAVVANGFKGYFSQAGIPATRIHRVRNPAQLGEPTKSRNVVRTELGWKSDEFVVLHSGSMGYKQGLESVVDTAELARSDAQLRFVFQGDGSQKNFLKTMVKERGLGNVDFLALASTAELPNVLCAADALLVTQRKSVQDMSMPSKLGSYFQSGLPTVAAVAAGGEVAREVQLAGGGVITEPEDPRLLLEAIYKLRAHKERARELGISGRAFAERELSAESAAERFDSFLQAVLCGRQMRREE
jgi:glycosyltransferase involved in cell wall biosynthesis